jgi:integrase
MAPETPARTDLIRTQHNAWLKSFIGEVKSGQGNHRLRKYCATRIYAEEMAAHHNEAKAATRVKEYLRHSKEATALLHYIAKNDERLATVTDATLMPAVVAATA